MLTIEKAARMLLSGAAVALLAFGALMPQSAFASDGNVAKIGDTEYPTLAAAVEAAPTDGTATAIVMTGDIEMVTADIVTIDDGQNVTLDMAGHAITVDEADFETRPITVAAGGVLTVTGNGTIDSSAAGAQGFGAINNFGTLIIENGTFRGALKANATNVWNRKGGTLTINGGTFDTSATAVSTEEDTVTTINGGTFMGVWYAAFDNNGYATINGGTFVGKSCSRCDSDHWAYTLRSGNASDSAYLRINYADVTGTQGALSTVGGTADIYDGTFETVDCDQQHGAVFYAYYVAGEAYTTSATIYGGDFSSSKRQALYVGNSQGDGGREEDATVVVKGGTFTGGDDSKTAIKVDQELGSAYITGGTFSSQPDEAWLADGYSAEQDASGNWITTVANPVAAVSSTQYPTVQDAIDNANGGTVMLLADVEENVTVPKGATVTLDLAGKKISNDGTDSQALGTIYNLGTLTVTDSVGGGNVDNVTHGKCALYNEVGATVTLDGGTFSRSAELSTDGDTPGGNSYYVLLNHGSMTVNEGTTVRFGEGDEYGKFSSLVEKGWYNGTQNITKTPSVMTINGGTFSGGLNTIKNDDWGQLTINDGAFNNVAQAVVVNWNVAEINNGTFESEQYVVLNGQLDDTMDKGQLTITGGAFMGGEGYKPVTQMSGSQSIGEVAISGGSFWEAPEPEHIIEGSGFVQNADGTYGIKKATLSAVSSGEMVLDPDETAKLTQDVILKMVTIDVEGYDLTVDDAELESVNSALASRTPGSFAITVTATKDGDATDALAVVLPFRVAIFHTVTFVSNVPGSSPTSVRVEDGAVVARPASPTLDGYRFAAWYTTESLDKGTEYDFDTLVTSDITLYGGWYEIDAATGEASDAVTGQLAQTGDSTALMVGGFATAAVIAVGAGIVAMRRRAR